MTTLKQSPEMFDKRLMDFKPDKPSHQSYLKKIINKGANGLNIDKAKKDAARFYLCDVLFIRPIRTNFFTAWRLTFLTRDYAPRFGVARFTTEKKSRLSLEPT